ncbi:hypothetical protein MFLO_07777 [Listeria floridensis FSL S10-1187]|uniref:Uncharacterized protein n=1 Tax=Listeria floridensis FSL S10-1187 TaxID=1265817 RepID=A0ABN0RFN3_9LIST|nr:DUF3397 domain-containing protein [Listeria floridensis]EUJ32067.1 hypothetical protein MFLO_07777 [Listeria floridensis FSL S10-1187]
MFDWITEFAAWLLILPAVLFFIIYIFFASFPKTRNRAPKWAADGSTFFLILAVHVWMLLLFGHSFLLYLLLVLFILGIVIIIAYARRDGELYVSRVFRTYWRLCFFCFWFSILIALCDWSCTCTYLSAFKLMNVLFWGIKWGMVLPATCPHFIF